MVTVISRQQWGARYGRGHPLAGTVAEINIHHTVSPDDYASAAAEVAEVQGIERFHAVSNGWGRIGYTHLIAPSGAAYEGCGWGQVGAHTAGRNSKSYGLAFLGNGEIRAATPAAWSTARALIEDGIRAGYVTPYPRVYGHRAWKATACPGAKNMAKLDLLAGISGEGVEEEGDMPLNTNDLAAIEDVVRRVLNEGTGPGQDTWAGTSRAHLDGLQRTYNYARDTNAVLKRIEATLAPNADTQVLPAPPEPR